MRCRKTQKLLSARFDGEIHGAADRTVEAHLSRCPACQRFAADLPICSQTLDVVFAPEPRSGFTERVMARLPERQSSGPLSRERLRAFRPAEVAAGGLGLAAGVIMAVLMNGEQVVATARAADLTQRMYAESFDPLPGGSAAANYVALVTESAR